MGRGESELWGLFEEVFVEPESRQVVFTVKECENQKLAVKFANLRITHNSTEMRTSTLEKEQIKYQKVDSL